MTKSREHKRELQIYFYSFSNAALYGSKSSSSRPNCRNPKKEPSTHFIEGLNRSGLYGEDKHSLPLSEFEPRKGQSVK